MERPYIAGEFETLYKPSQTGEYVNDHTFVKTNDGRWHLYGISGFADDRGIKASVEDYNTHAVSPALYENREFSEQGKLSFADRDIQAPFIFQENGIFYLFDSGTKDGAHLAISTDAVNWTDKTSEYNIVNKSAYYRDPMLYKDGDRYLMYSCGSDRIKSEGKLRESFWLSATRLKWQNKHIPKLKTSPAIVVYESKDLFNWKKVNCALKIGGDATLSVWGSCESPHILKRGDYYYLFVTITDSMNMSTYNMTHVFRSKSLTDFGYYDGKLSESKNCEFVTMLPVHAPEIIDDGDKQYITTCGWGTLVPHSNAQGGVGIAELKWTDASAPEGNNAAVYFEDSFDGSSILGGWMPYMGYWRDTADGLKVTSHIYANIVRQGICADKFMYEADMKLDSKDGYAGLLFCLNASGLNGYSLTIGSKKISLNKYLGKKDRTIKKVNMTFALGTVYHLSVTVDCGRIKICVDGKEVMDIKNRKYDGGRFGLTAYSKNMRDVATFCNVKASNI